MVGHPRPLGHHLPSGNSGTEEMRAAKTAELARLRDSLTALGLTSAGDLNNARLAAVATYHRCVPALTALLGEHGGNLPAYYAAIRALARDSAARSLLCANH